VQVFGTATHDWLRRNSLRYGWFLPAWAMPGGSKPEPWHWEYAG
jgi:LAS superfamily LD-carboxypeptidase LdcB